MNENILINDSSYKPLIDPNRLRFKFDKIDGFNRIYDETRYLTLFSSEKFEAIYNRIRYLIILKSGIRYILTQYFTKLLILMILYL